MILSYISFSHVLILLAKLSTNRFKHGIYSDNSLYKAMFKITRADIYGAKDAGLASYNNEERNGIT